MNGPDATLRTRFLSGQSIRPWIVVFSILFLGFSILGAKEIPAGALVLPGDGFFPGWQTSGKASVFLQTDLFNHIDGGADIFLEFGFERVTVQRYRNDKAEIALEVYEMQSPDAALGVYLMKCGQESPLPEIPARNSSETAQFTMLKGRYFILVNNLDGEPGSVPAMKVLVKGVLKTIPEEKAALASMDVLPREKRIPGSERLVRGPVALQPYYTFGEGDILRLGGRIYGALANFREPGGQVSNRLIVTYLGGKEALAVFRGLQENLDPYLKILETRGEAFLFVDFKERYGVVRLAGATIDLCFNLPARPALKP
jgi:hypothetical protein